MLDGIVLFVLSAQVLSCWVFTVFQSRLIMLPYQSSQLSSEWITLHIVEMYAPILCTKGDRYLYSLECSLWSDNLHADLQTYLPAFIYYLCTDICVQDVKHWFRYCTCIMYWVIYKSSAVCVSLKHIVLWGEDSRVVIKIKIKPLVVGRTNWRLLFIFAGQFQICNIMAAIHFPASTSWRTQLSVDMNIWCGVKIWRQEDMRHYLLHNIL